MSGNAQDVVIGFCEAWDRSDIDAILGYLAPDVVYQNVPAPVMHGRDEAAQFLVPLLKKASKIEFKLLSIAVSASGDQVLTERLDRLHFATGVVDIPLMGIFVVRNGQISEWRDYADNGPVVAQFVEAKIDLSKLD
ncbi:limonene-1,2-epoxide hydrolase family protein [Novosphingobium sp.]|uniref:limonene-1,2-epoxide hydrolase family protein n=1 Tax=Novosphingobium sp. TaxID=1874826 RepID=UPI002FD89524